MAKAESKPGLTAEKIQEKINEKLSAKHTLQEQLYDRLREKLHQARQKLDGLQDKVHDHLSDHSCCKMCNIVIFVGIFATLILYVFLIVARLEKSVQPSCGMRCTLRAAHWAKLTDAQLKYLGAADPDEVLDALSTAWLEHHAGQFAEDHRAKHQVGRLQDAHDRMSVDLEELGKKWKSVQSMPDGASKIEMLKDIVKKSDSIEAMAAEVGKGKSFNEVKLGKMTAADAYEMRDCAEILRTVSVEPCSKDPGIATGFLRSLGVSPTLEQHHPQPPKTWPVNLQYPGLRVLDADHGIYIVDDFLSSSDRATLMRNSSTVQVQNRTSVSHASFAALHTSSTPRAHTHERRVPKWMYTGMPGALIELDIKSHEDQKDCMPSGGDQTADAWKETVGPLFKERGKDVQTCETSGFGDTRYYDVACPLDIDTVQQVESKIAQLTHSAPTQLQPLKLSHYGRGDFDLDHYDTDAQNTNGKVAPLMSVMVYLSSAKGGATYFPNLDLRVDPIPGRALVFPTLSMNLSVATGSLHAEEEVKKGDKWVLGTSVFLGRRDESPNPCVR